MGEGLLLVALGCGRLPRMLDIAARRPFIVFGTLEREVLASIAASNLPVYFYETG
jgi:hypothetical protein